MRNHYASLVAALSLIFAAAAYAAPASNAAAATAAPSIHAPGPAPAEPHFAVPFIADDYAKALHEARARKVPIFIEAWAPW